MTTNSIEIYPERTSNVPPTKDGVEQINEINSNHGTNISPNYEFANSIAVWAIIYNAVRASYHIPPFPRDEAICEVESKKKDSQQKS